MEDEDVRKALEKVIIEVGDHFYIRKISTIVRGQRFSGVGKLLPKSLCKALPKINTISGRSNGIVSTECIAYGNLQNGIYLVQFSAGKSVKILMFGLHEYRRTLLAIDFQNQPQIIQYISAEKGYPHPHTTTSISRDSIANTVHMFEPRAFELSKHKLLFNEIGRAHV